MNKLTLVICLGLLSSLILPGQTRLKRKADESFDRLAYASAIPFYLRAWDKSPDPGIVLKLAECYRLVSDYDNEFIWLEKAMAQDAVAPETYFHYGHALMMKQRFEEAKEKFEQFSILAPEDPRGLNYIKSLDQLELMKNDSARYTIELLEINTEEAEFGAVPYKNGILFSSARYEGSIVVQQFDWVEKPFLDIWYAEPTGTDKKEWTNPKALGGEINSRYHESCATFFPDDSGNMLFTRNNFLKGEKGKSTQGVILLKIYEAMIEDMSVRNVREISLNNDNYNNTHPSLSGDGSLLYFSSNMPGGFGGSDIYVSKRAGDSWSVPENLGPEINTPGNEVFPFIHSDGTFYYSSDGMPGLGSLDVYEVRWKDREPQIRNLGYPLNSPYDDFAIWMNEEREGGYVSSNRPGGKGNDDIYAFSVVRPLVEIIVEDSIAKLPIEDAKVFVRDFRFNVTMEYKTDLMGRISFKTDYGEDFSAVVRTLEFEPKQLKMSTHVQSGKEIFTYTVRLYNPPPAITALVVDEKTKESVPGARIELVKLLTQDTIKRVTDRNGRFAVKLEKNTYYKMTVRSKGYLTFTDKFSTTAESFDGDTIIPMRLEKIPFNKPIVLENIHYDFDKWTIRADAYNSLIYLGNIVKDNPNLIVELSSHTDSRGGDAYNLQLSQKRATAARIFLLDLGVDPERIIAKGYGETKLVNKCSNGVTCADSMHFKNRRTEFKIIGEVFGIDNEHSILETMEERNGKIVVDPNGPEYYPEKNIEDDPNAPVETVEEIDPATQLDTRLKVKQLSEGEKWGMIWEWLRVTMGVE